MSRARFTDEDESLLTRGAGIIWGMRNALNSLTPYMGPEVRSYVKKLIEEGNETASALDRRAVQYEFRFTLKKLIQGIFWGLPLRYIKEWSTDPDWGQGGG